MRAYGSTRGVEFEVSSKFTVVHARQLDDEVIEVGGQCRRFDLAVSDVEQFADVQRRLRAARSESIAVGSSSERR
jgi:hypothetical protein